VQGARHARDVSPFPLASPHGVAFGLEDVYLARGRPAAVLVVFGQEPHGRPEPVASRGLGLERDLPVLEAEAVFGPDPGRNDRVQVDPGGFIGGLVAYGFSSVVIPFGPKGMLIVSGGFTLLMNVPAWGFLTREPPKGLAPGKGQQAKAGS